MKNPEAITKSLFLNLAIFTLLTIYFGQTSCKAEQENDEASSVYSAWEIRMNGQADAAKLKLQQFTETHPNQALAWYELSRNTHHMGLADLQNIAGSISEALEYIEKAVKLEPENAQFQFYKGKLLTLQFYMKLKFGKSGTGDLLHEIETAYNTAYDLDASYTEGLITLVEFFEGLPPGSGGDNDKAEMYASKLENTDLIAGAKAREILMPEDADYIKFWQDIVNEAPENPDAQLALGRIYLFYEDIQNAEACYQKAMNLDPAKNMCLLDLGRYYLMIAMQNPNLLDSLAPVIKSHFEGYLNSNPEPSNPMKAWTYSKLAMVENHSGNTEQAQNYMNLANKLDPFHSPAFGKPGLILFAPPDEAVHEQGYYFTPF